MHKDPLQNCFNTLKNVFDGVLIQKSSISTQDFF